MSERPSSVPPPSRAKWAWAWFGFLVAVTGLVVTITQRIALAPTPSAERGAEKPDPNAAPVPVLGKPDPTPTTDDGVIACRELELKLNRVLEAYLVRIVALEDRTCDDEREDRLAYALIIELAVKQRCKTCDGAAATWFMGETESWNKCRVDGRPSLREKANSALMMREAWR